jgi:hypothetical protein
LSLGLTPKAEAEAAFAPPWPPQQPQTTTYPVAQARSCNPPCVPPPRFLPFSLSISPPPGMSHQPTASSSGSGSQQRTLLPTAPPSPGSASLAFDDLVVPMDEEMFDPQFELPDSWGLDGGDGGGLGMPGEYEGELTRASRSAHYRCLDRDGSVHRLDGGPRCIDWDGASGRERLALL